MNFKPFDFLSFFNKDKLKSIISFNNNDQDLKLEKALLFNRTEGFLYVFSIIITFIAIYFVVSGGNLLDPASVWIIILLILNFFIICYFGYSVYSKFTNLINYSRKISIGTKLLNRNLRLFIFVAALPAIIIALFSGLSIGRGVQSWLSSQVKTAIEATSSFGKETISQASNSAKNDILAMSNDLNLAYAAYNKNPIEYKNYFAGQAARRGFSAAYLVNSRGLLLMTVEKPKDAPEYIAPDSEDFATVNIGDVDLNIDESMIIRGLFKLTNYNDVYLQVTRLPSPVSLSLLQKAEQVVFSYRSIEERQSQIQIVFGLAYFEIVLLVIIGAAWLGLFSATTITMPISQLLNAANRVRSGDLSVRVDENSKIEEITSLAKSFNNMTHNLESQRSALENAKIQAEGKTQFIQAILDGVSAGIISLDKDFNAKTINDAAAKLLNLNIKDFSKASFIKIVPEFEEIIKSAKPDNISNANIELNRDNKEYLFDVKATYVGEDIIITFDEVSNLLAAQRQVAWRDVARRIAHEIKNPLTPIQLSAERIARKYSKFISEDEKQTFIKMTDTIIRQVTDIGRMVDEFSSFARMPAPKFAEFDICEILKQAVFDQKITNTDIIYELSVPPECIKISMDDRLIAQAIGNILKNAAESISQNSKTNLKQIDTALIVDNNFVLITITDTGIGFPKTNRKKLLEPYMTTRVKGTGLGLAIVSKIIEDHGGSLILNDRSDSISGASVIIKLPMIKNIIETETQNGF